MPPRNPDLEKQTMNFRRGDWDYLSSVLQSRGIPTSTFVRDLVSKKVDELRARLDPQPERIDLNVE